MYKDIYKKIEKYIKKNSKRIDLELSGPFFVFNAPEEKK